MGEKIRNLLPSLAAALGLCLSAAAQPRDIRPGVNAFSRDQDIQLGKEAASQVLQKSTMIRDTELTNYVTGIGQRLARSPKAGGYPYTFQIVYDKAINAFSLPGGPVFINTGLIENCDNEAQLAGVMGHEMAHVALRHATNQATKANALRIPAAIIGAVTGGGMLGQLAGLGASSFVLKFSRTAESEADYVGAEMMSEAGYNPLEMAHFFEKLEKQAGRQGSVAQFLSDHPNPGNRVAAVQQEIQQLPQRAYNADSGQFPKEKDRTFHLAPNSLQGQYGGSHSDGHQPGVPSSRPSSSMKQYSSSAFSLSYPDNWQAYGEQQGTSVTIAPREGLVQSANNQVAIGYGATISFYQPQGDSLDLNRDTQGLIQQLTSQNAGMRVNRPARELQVAGQRALLTQLSSRSPFQGEQEVDAVVTVPRPQGLFYFVFIAPESEWSQIQPAFEAMLRSIQFSDR